MLIQPCHSKDIFTSLTKAYSNFTRTDWEKCALCQENMNEKLICPADSKKRDAGSWYITLADDLGEFSWMFI